MAYISSFVYCDSIQNEITPQGPRSRINNPLQVLSPIAIPGNFSFAISLNIAGFDASIDNTLSLSFSDPSSFEIYNSGNVNIKLPNEGEQLVKPTAIQFNLDLRNIIVPVEGIYSTKVFFNSVEIGNYKIEVVKGKWNGYNQ